WLDDRGLGPGDLTVEVIGRFAAHRRRQGYTQFLTPRAPAPPGSYPRRSAGRSSSRRAHSRLWSRTCDESVWFLPFLLRRRHAWTCSSADTLSICGKRVGWSRKRSPATPPSRHAYTAAH